MSRQVACYCALAFGFSWSCWAVAWLIAQSAPESAWLPPVLVFGSFGPFIGAFLVQVSFGSHGAVRRYFARGLQFRIGWPPFLLATLLMPILAIGAAALYAQQHELKFKFEIDLADVPLTYIGLFFLGGPVAEECGWCYLTDAMETWTRRPLVPVLVGTIWACWHIPLFFLIVPGMAQHYMPFGLFLLLCLALRYLYSWGYYRSGRSIFANLLFHNSTNFAISIVTIVPPIIGADHQRLWYLTLAAVVSAALVWLIVPRAVGQTA